MEVTQTITLNEKQLTEIILKALKLDKNSSVRIDKYSGDMREASYCTATITTKTNINPE